MHESIILPRSEWSRLMATVSSTLLSSLRPYPACDFVVPPIKSCSQFPSSWNLGWPVTCPGQECTVAVKLSCIWFLAQETLCVSIHHWRYWHSCLSKLGLVGEDERWCATELSCPQSHLDQPTVTHSTWWAHQDQQSLLWIQLTTEA